MRRAEARSAARRALAGLAATVALATATGDLMAQGKHIVYIEASTVHNWKLDGFPARTRSDRYRFQVLREYEFDKSKLVEQVLAGGPPRPYAVIVQECSAYFPGDLAAYQQMYRGWISKLQALGLRPVIATVVPPAATRGRWQDAKDFVKVRLLGRPSQYDQVVAFNDWLRALGSELGVPVLDLERMLRVSAEDRHMRPEYNAGDGIHLAPAAYQRLDGDLLEFLDRLEPRAKAN